MSADARIVVREHREVLLLPNAAIDRTGDGARVRIAEAPTDAPVFVAIRTGASDGFTLMFPYFPGGLDDFINRMIPVLQDRRLFRKAYEGKTLSENLGLPRPENRFFANG